MRTTLATAIVATMAFMATSAAAQSGPSEEGGGLPTGVSAGQVVDAPDQTVLDAALGLGEYSQMTVSLGVVGDWFSEYIGQDGREDDQFRTSGVLRLAYKTNWTRSTLFLANSFSLSHTHPTGRINTTILNFSGTYSHTGDRLFTSATGQIIGGEDPGNLNSSGLTREPSDRLQLSAALRLRNQMTPRSIVNLTSQATRTDRAENFDDAGVRLTPSLYNRLYNQVDFDLRASPVTTWRLGYRNIIVFREDPNQQNHLENSAQLGYQRDLSDRASLGLSYAYRRSRRDTRLSADAHDISASYGYALRPRLGLGFSGYMDIFERRADSDLVTNLGVRANGGWQIKQNLSMQIGAGVAILETPDDGRQYLPLTQFSLVGSLIRRATTTLSVSSQQSVENTRNDADDIGFVLRSRASVDFRHQRSRQWDLGAFVRYIQTEPLELRVTDDLPADQDQYVSAGGTSNWAFGQNVGLTMRYVIRFRVQSLDDDPRDDRTNQRFTVALTTAFSGR